MTLRNIFKRNFHCLNVFHSSPIVKTLLKGKERFCSMFFSKEEGFVQSIMLLHAPFTGLICFEEKKINLLTKSNGNFS